uniref:Uncharacterized protein n=1 Tax=Anopheles epiroticus TaxID=199890 RepID=A0A182PIA8_9DIPT
MVIVKQCLMQTIRFHGGGKMLKKLRLSDVPFKDIPYSVLQLQNITDLEQSHSRMRHFQMVALRTMKSLTDLNLSHNKIQTITADPEAVCCEQLECLNLIGNSLVRFNFGTVTHVQNLQRLFLGHNQIEMITTDMNLQSLDKRNFCSWKSYYLRRMEEDQEIAQPPCIDYFANLKDITLNKNKLTTIDMSLFEWMNLLSDIDLAYNPIKTINIVQGKLPISLNLSQLNGEDGYLHKIPPDVFSYS